ncbi:DUF4249 domain-containing protein [Xanthomarina sp. F2636L]|uniref:DUF4249 domain-containing protein n=1 Tax=Xanthomarina sp. F2636L TaxID=2996018 RepID=UPI00225DCF75|nr:DUF4249 domain-containing protein [Xanthomarina sp. F2636L]MCX7552225.1 DUF4249 domain-containing protein [Xanthomarina sp. F2636L]
MKQKFIIVVVLLVSFFSCEDVIDVDVPTSEPRLVIDASINWFKGTTGNEQFIKLTLTAPYFDDGVPPANNALVTVEDQNNNVFEFIEDENSGYYYNNNFITEINGVYNLTIVYENETYIGTETLLAVPEIEFVEQNLEGGITGEDTEIKAYFTDPANEENYYFFEFIPNTPVIPTLDTFKDEFVNGNQVFGFYVEEELNPGDEVLIKNHGVSKRFYEFMYVLLQQTGSAGGPFETQPATVRGNCMNITNPENYPFGYFRLSEVSQVNYVIQP